jgi:deoxyribonuclease-4
LREDAETLKASDIPVYVHAPYLINVASPNNRVRIPSRKILANTLERAEEIGAAAVIVHGGHAEDGVEHGFRRWWKVFEEMGKPRVPVFIENTAGGENAMARKIPRVLEATGRIDLLHANSSRDAPGSGADRHANFDGGKMDPDVIVDMVKASKAPAVICETPWPGISDDMALLRKHV